METAELLTPTKLWTRTEVLARPCPVPESAGVYAWFLDSFPQGVPTNARVAWLACDEPWRIEEQMIRAVSLRLNLDQNRHHGFHSELSERRRAAKARARELPVV
jgi:hypothetical protein